MTLTFLSFFVLTAAHSAPPELPKWQLVDGGLTVATVNANYGGLCGLIELNVAQGHRSFVVSGDETISLDRRLLGGSDPRPALSIRPVLLVETLEGASLRNRLPTVTGAAPASGALQVVHVGAVLRYQDLMLSAPGGFLTALSACSFGEMDPAKLAIALSRLPRNQRQSAVALLNTWSILDDLSRHPPGVIIDVTGQPSNAGERACTIHQHCIQYTTSMIRRVGE